MKKYLFLTLFTAVAPGLCFGASARYTQLIREKQQKMEQLEKCMGTTKGLKIAGISTLGLTAVGVAGNIYEAKVIKDNDASIEKYDKKIEEVNLEIAEKQRIKEEERLREEQRILASRDCTATARADTNNPNADKVVSALKNLQTQECEIQQCATGFKPSADRKKCESDGTVVVTVPNTAIDCLDEIKTSEPNATAASKPTADGDCKITACADNKVPSADGKHCIENGNNGTTPGTTNCTQAKLDELKATAGTMEGNVCKVTACKGELVKNTDSTACVCPANKPVMNETNFTCSAQGGDTTPTPVSTKCTQEFLNSHNALNGVDCENNTACCIKQCKTGYHTVLVGIDPYNIIDDNYLDRDVTCKKNPEDKTNKKCSAQDLRSIHATDGKYQKSGSTFVCKPTACEDGYDLVNGQCKKKTGCNTALGLIKIGEMKYVKNKSQCEGEFRSEVTHRNIGDSETQFSMHCETGAKLVCKAKECPAASGFFIDENGMCKTKKERFTQQCQAKGGQYRCMGGWAMCKLTPSDGLSLTGDECNGLDFMKKDRGVNKVYSEKKPYADHCWADFYC